MERTEGGLATASTVDPAASARSPFARVRVRALVGWYLLYAIPLIAVTALIARALHRRLDDRVAAAVLTAAMALPPITLARRAGLRWRRLVGAPPRRSDLPLLAVMLPVDLFTMAVAFLVYVPLSYPFPEFVRRQLLINDVYQVTALWQWLVLVLAAAVLAPVLEEVLFRGFIMQRWAHRWGTTTGVVASSALFAVMHGEWPGHFLFGVVMCLLYLHTRRLAVPILAHAVSNFALVLPMLPQAIRGVAEPPETLASLRADAWMGWPLLAAAIATGWLWLRLLWPAGSVRAALLGPVPYEAGSFDQAASVTAPPVSTSTS